MILPEESLTRIAFQMNILIRHTDTVANVFETFVAYQTITNRSKANVTIVYLKLVVYSSLWYSLERQNEI